MGLDMYLYGERWMSDRIFTEDKMFTNPQFVDLAKLFDLNPKDLDGPVTIKFTVGYWRKANAIHNWFVKNVQGGKDECKPHHVSLEQLAELRKDCVNALAAYQKDYKDIAADILPPMSGFFFGSTDLNECYAIDLRNTIAIVDKCLNNDRFKDFQFSYRSCW